MSVHTDVDVLVNGKPIKTFAHQGKVFVQSNNQTEYSLRIRNPHWNRHLFIVSVDGINVVDGTKAGATKMGYIIDGYSSCEIEGYRTDLNTVHPFKFSNKQGKSYAAKTNGGETQNCGVIGIEVYTEKPQPAPVVIREKIIYRDRPRRKPFYPWDDGGTPVNPYHPPVFWSSTSDVETKGSLTGHTKSASSNREGFMVGSNATRGRSFGGGQSANFLSFNSNLANTVADSADESVACAASFSMGTEFSDKAVTSRVREVQFDVGTLIATFTIYYGSRQDLINMGVPIVKEKKIAAFPQAFPSRFCKHPGN